MSKVRDGASNRTQARRARPRGRTGHEMKTLWQCPDAAVAALVFAHGAGAGMTHRNIQSLADAFERAGIATLRFNFPFVDAGRKRPDSPAVATATIAEAFATAAVMTPLPLWLGGHSFGGRMASHAVLHYPLSPQGLIFCSFPLHPPNKPSVTRVSHLAAIHLPMLFLSGTRDALATPKLLESVVADLPTGELHWLDTADHGYRTLKRTRKTPEDVFDEIATVTRDFIERHHSDSPSSS